MSRGVQTNGSGINPHPGSLSSRMDIPRKGYRKRCWRNRLLLAAGLATAVGAVTFFVSQLKPALPSVDRNAVWIDTVVRGPLVRDVRGIGTLVPEDVRWIPARTDARVERIVVWPGTQVTKDMVLLVLSSAELEQQALDSDAAIKSAQAKLTQLKAQLEGELLERQAALTKAKADRDTAAVEMEVDDRLAKRGLIASLDFKKAQITAAELAENFEVEKERYDFAKQSIEPRLAVAQGELDQAKAQAGLYHGQVDALQVRAGMNGVLQQIAVDVGQRVSAGTNLARTADNTKLKAQIKIPETQARDVALGQIGRIDMRNGSILTGTVSRIDPALVGSPSILLADEPTGNLDSKNGDAVMELLSELHQGGATICMVTHDSRFAQYAQRTVHLFDGQIVAEDGEIARDRSRAAPDFMIDNCEPTDC
jgi:HlyD family secretion protein